MTKDEQEQEKTQAKILDFGSRKGRFFISSERIFDTPFKVQKLLSRTLIRSAQHSWERKGVEYSGHSFDFEPVEPGVKGHWYRAIEKDGELRFVKDD